MHILIDLWRFTLARRKYWLLPMMLVAVIYGALAVFAKVSAVTPLLYALF